MQHHHTFALVAAATTLFTAISARAQDATGHGPIGVQQPPTPRALSVGEWFGLDFVPAPEVRLGAIDHDAFLFADELTAQPAPLRFAIPRPTGLTIDQGAFVDVEGGRVWRVEVAATGALSSRVQITGLHLADGQRLSLTSVNVPDAVIGDITDVGEFGTGLMWSYFAPTESVRIEWFVPTGSAVKQLPFASADYSHGYRDIFGPPQPGDGGLAGNCHNDPLCYPAWAVESAATARMLFGTGYLCSGQLMATTAADETPYFSTANHCISTQSDANSCQFNFFYRDSTCNGSTSAGSTVTGSDLSATYGTSDCTLLLVRPTLPANTGWSGWSSTSQATNSASTGIHHPGGAPQAISFGTKNANSYNCGSPSTNWSSLSWNNGITEGGSSGSAIYRDSDRKLYGVLTCGTSSCQNTAGDDGYGRWDVAVNNGGFGALLAAGSDDAQEPNDSCAAPKALASGSYSGLVVKRLDEDWYQLTSAAGTLVTVTATYIYGNGDIDMQLFSACGGTAVASETNNATNATMNYTNNSGSNTLLLRVYLGTDVRNDYSLSVTTSAPTAPPHNECATPSSILAASTPFTTVGATTSASSGTIPSSCNDGAGVAMYNDVWYRFYSDCDGTVTFSTCGASFDTRLAVYTGFQCPTSSTAPVACDDNTTGCASNGSRVSFDTAAGAVHYVRLGSPVNATGTGTIVYSCTPYPACPADLDGDGSVGGIDLGMLLGAWGTADGDVDGSGSTDGGDLAVMLGGWGPC